MGTDIIARDAHRHEYRLPLTENPKPTLRQALADIRRRQPEGDWLLLARGSALHLQILVGAAARSLPAAPSRPASWLDRGLSGLPGSGHRRDGVQFADRGPLCVGRHRTASR